MLLRWQFFAAFYLIANFAMAQSLPLGLSEGLMGNSGGAITESTVLM